MWNFACLCDTGYGNKLNSFVINRDCTNYCVSRNFFFQFHYDPYTKFAFGKKFNSRSADRTSSNGGEFPETVMVGRKCSRVTCCVTSRSTKRLDKSSNEVLVTSRNGPSSWNFSCTDTTIHNNTRTASAPTSSPRFGTHSTLRVHLPITRRWTLLQYLLDSTDIRQSFDSHSTAT